MQKGEDLGGIAWRYHLSIEALKTANPTVLPRAMSVGTVLIIPASGTPQPVQPADVSSAGANPTPLPVTVEPLRCTPSVEGGVWCFQMAQNSMDNTIEALTARVRMTGISGEPQERSATLLLDTLPPGAGLPFIAYFSPAQVSALTPPLQFQSQIQSALPSADDQRYLRTNVSEQVVQRSVGGKSALISANLSLAQNYADAQRVWVAAVAFDAQGQVVGTRRWEKPADVLLKKGESLPFQMTIYSVSEPIERVTLLAESRP